MTHTMTHTVNPSTDELRYLVRKINDYESGLCLMVL